MVDLARPFKEVNETAALAAAQPLPAGLALPPHITPEAFGKVLNVALYGSPRGLNSKPNQIWRGASIKSGNANQIKIKGKVGCSATGSMLASYMQGILAIIAELSEGAMTIDDEGLHRQMLSAEAEPTQQDKVAWHLVSRLGNLAGLPVTMLDHHLKARYLDLIGAPAAESEEDLPGLDPVEWDDVRAPPAAGGKREARGGPRFKRARLEQEKGKEGPGREGARHALRRFQVA